MVEGRDRKDTAVRGPNTSGQYMILGMQYDGGNI